MWKKVIALTAVASLFSMAAGALTTYYINWLDASHARVLSENVTTIRASGAMLEIIWKLEALVMDAAQRGRDEFRNEVPEFEAAFEEELKVAEISAYMPEEFGLLETIRTQFKLYCQQIESRLQPGAVAAAQVHPTVAETMVLARSVADPCKQVLELNEHAMQGHSDQRSRLSLGVNYLRITLLVIGPAVWIGFGFSLARSLHRSLSQISVTLRDATGELEEEVGHVDVTPSSDLPALRHQVRAVSVRIRHVMDELQAARNNAVRAERLAAVGQLAAGVAHGLRNPLTSVKLLIQTAGQRHPDGRLGDKQMQVVEEEIARMESTIQGLLDLAGPPKLRRLRHDLRDTVRRALNLVEGRAIQERVSVAQQLPDSPVLIDGDAEQLHQVFINLMLNGIEAMDDGGELRVSVEQDGPAADFCRVLISDTGSGIPESMLSKIFEPFITSKAQGTGLGLAISRRVVLEHGGNLFAANRQDRGAVFTVQLPLRSEGQDTSGTDLHEQRSDTEIGQVLVPHFDPEATHA